MLRKMRNTLSYWKLVMVFVIFLYTLVILLYQPDQIGLKLNDAIRAPFFALCSAGTLFIGMLPRKTMLYDKVVDLTIRLVGGYSACLGGWYWLLGETQGDPTPYLALLAPILIFIGISVFIVPFSMFVVSLVVDEL